MDGDDDQDVVRFSVRRCGPFTQTLDMSEVRVAPTWIEIARGMTRLFGPAEMDLMTRPDGSALSIGRLMAPGSIRCRQQAPYLGQCDQGLIHETAEVS